MMKTILSIATIAAAVLAACSHEAKTSVRNHSMPATDSVSSAVTDKEPLLYKTEVDVDSIPFLLLEMNSKTCRVEMADSVIPNINDSSIALCVEAAFTGKLLHEFKSENVSGDYIVGGKLKKGYKTNGNTGFLAAENGVPFIAPAGKLRQWLKGNHADDCCMFQQVLLVQNGKNVYDGKLIKTTSKNIYRAACIMHNGQFAVIQSLKELSFGQFIHSLVELKVSDALYLDMGTGWNYGWYRLNKGDNPVKFFNYRTPFQTNWLLIKVK